MRQQSVFEYLVTYIWAILAMVMVIVVLLATGIINVNFLQSYAAPGSCRVMRPYGPSSTELINLVGVCNQEIPEFVLTSRGVGDFVQIPNSNRPKDTLNITNNVTITAWVYVHGSPYHDVVDKEGQYGMKLDYDNNPHQCTPSNATGWCLEWDTSDSWIGQGFQIPGAAYNQWMFLAVTQQASSAGSLKYWYANGNLLGVEEIGSLGAAGRCTLNNSGQNLQFSNLSYCDLSGANFKGANLQDANLAGSVITGANFKGANLQHANFKCTQGSAANFSGANLQHGNLSESTFIGANFSGANAQFTNFSGSNLNGANFKGANTNMAIFKNSTTQNCPSGPSGASDTLGYANAILVIGAISPNTIIGYGSAEWFNGSVADVQLYNATLSPNDIRSIYLEGIGGSPIDLRQLEGWWPLNGNANDYSGNNQSGIITNQSYYGARSWDNNYYPP